LLSALSAECWLTIAPPVSMWWHSCCERLSSLALLWMDSWKEETEGSCLVQAQLFYSQEADGITGRRVGRAWSLLCSASGASRPAWDPQGPRVCFSWQDSPWHFAGDPQQGLGSPSASRQEAFLLLPADLPWEQLGMSFLSAEGAPLVSFAELRSHFGPLSSCWGVFTLPKRIQEDRRGQKHQRKHIWPQQRVRTV
jgi:hypothetical protein